MVTGSSNKAKKSLGQHWLVDPQSLQLITSVADLKPDDIVLEIGPGTGNLTKLLLEKVKQVIAVELDDRLIANLSKLASEKLAVLHQDILNFDFESLPANYKIVANIPYYLTGKLIRLISETSNRPKLVVLLVQKEIAERMSARPGSLSILGLISQYYWQVDKGSLITSDKFNPSPSVDSQIVILRPNDDNNLDNDQRVKLFRLIKVGFSSPRKTILNNLYGSYHVDKQVLSTLLEGLNINPKSRPQDLNLDQWLNIQKALA